jgi:hypothetical protein
MLGFLGVAVTELATGKTAWAQMGSGGLVTALLLMGAVSAASVAPVLTCVRRWGGAGAQQASTHRVLLAAANLRRGAVAANKLYPSGACLARVRRARAALPALDTRPGAPRPVGALTRRRTETDSYANERLPETWTPTAEVVNSRVASARPYARIAATAAQKASAHAALCAFLPRCARFLCSRVCARAPLQWLRSCSCWWRSWSPAAPRCEAAKSDEHVRPRACLRRRTVSALGLGHTLLCISAAPPSRFL